MRAQAELIALVAPKRTAAKAKSPTEDESEPDAEDNAPITPSPPPPDFSQMSDEEVLRAAGMKPFPIAPSRPNPEPKRAERPKGYQVSGTAKKAKEHAQQRLERGQREREARAHLMRGHDATIAWPMPTIPEEWGDE